MSSSSRHHRQNHSNNSTFNGGQRTIDSMFRGQSSNRSRGRGRGGGRPLSAARQAEADIAKETLAVLPGILKELPHIHAEEAEVWNIDALPALNPAECPKYPKKAVFKVINEDTFNAALDLAAKSTATNPKDRGARVAVLNFASEAKPGGGWLRGATAQEEALCYRSSLALSLHKRFYPIQRTQGLYTPDVVIIREAKSNGHGLLTPGIHPTDLPVVSVVSIAAERGPATTTRAINVGGTPKQVPVFAKKEDRDLLKTKMRLTLRIAAAKGHGLLVLGALGCGVFKNPPADVAQCWVEVFQENEFAGGWWKEVWFAVYDARNEGNFDLFDKMLQGFEF